MYSDPIVDEVHRIREELARAHDFDLDRICADLMSRQGKDGRKVVSRAAKKLQSALPDLAPDAETSSPTTSTSPSTHD